MILEKNRCQMRSVPDEIRPFGDVKKMRGEVERSYEKEEGEEEEAGCQRGVRATQTPKISCQLVSSDRPPIVNPQSKK